MSIDPLTQVYNALWELVADSEELANFVREGNRIKLNRHNPLKQNIAASDVPELLLVPSSALSNLHQTSSSSQLQMTFEWVLVTGSMDITEFLLPVSWELFRAMRPWGESLKGLTWNGEEFVKKLELLNMTTGQSDAQRNRGIEGFTSIWACEVTMIFKSSLLE